MISISASSSSRCLREVEQTRSGLHVCAYHGTLTDPTGASPGTCFARDAETVDGSVFFDSMCGCRTRPFRRCSAWVAYPGVMEPRGAAGAAGPWQGPGSARTARLQRSPVGFIGFMRRIVPTSLSLGLICSCRMRRRRCGRGVRRERGPRARRADGGGRRDRSAERRRQQRGRGGRRRGWRRRRRRGRGRRPARFEARGVAITNVYVNQGVRVPVADGDQWVDGRAARRCCSK